MADVEYGGGVLKFKPRNYDRQRRLELLGVQDTNRLGRAAQDYMLKTREDRRAAFVKKPLSARGSRSPKAARLAAGRAEGQAARQWPGLRRIQSAPAGMVA